LIVRDKVEDNAIISQNLKASNAITGCRDELMVSYLPGHLSLS